MARASAPAGPGLIRVADGEAPLAAILRRRIALEGPMTVADFMATCLGHPRHGYYITRDPLGEAGDFTTAPEISQMFGELLGLWCAQLWLDAGRPSPFLLAELGPGRGTLMADALRAVRGVPGFLDAARVHLVETSPVLRERQAAALNDAAPVWHDTPGTLPELPGFILANEFFDALPVRQFQRTALGWRERLVGERDGAFAFVLAEQPTPSLALVPPGLAREPVGSIIEVSPVSLSIAREIGERVARLGGAALVIDYGHAGPAVGDTFQAVHRHRFASPLDAPGEADLTTHVDFGALLAAGRSGGAFGWGPVGQGEFLGRLGIAARAAMLKRRATAAQGEAIEAALHRLTSPEEMGGLFKVVALTAADRPPPGFHAPRAEGET